MTAEEDVPLTQNDLLAAVEASELAALEPLMTVRDFEIREQLYHRNEAITTVVFPLDGIFSMVSEMDDGRAVEVATVGRDGMVGLPIFLQASRTSSHQAFVQVAGRGCFIDADTFVDAIDRLPSLQRVLHRYTLSLLGQIAQSSACNRLHDVEQRASRWLLLTHDRVGRDTFLLTQEFLGQMLGIPRARVNAAAQSLARAGAIDYTRGIVTIIDRKRLEDCSCECYRNIADEHRRLFGDTDQ